MTTNVYVAATATWNGKALTKAKKDLTVFDSSIRKLGKTFAGVFAASEVIRFGKSSVNAFLRSEKAAAGLRTTIDNLGLSYEQTSIEKYIKGLSLQYGITSENLIPAFQSLLIVTRDLASAQSLFDTALNVSAGTGKDLASVSTTLGKAFLGDTTALGRLGVGLDKASLKTAKFTDLQNTLNRNYQGQAANAVKGYAGDVAKLTVAVDQAKGAIGKGLLDALAAVGGDGSIEKLTGRIVTLGEAIGAVITAVAKDLNPGAPMASKYVPSGRSLQTKKADVAANVRENRLNQAFKVSISLRKLENEQLKAKTEVDKLRDKFDVERIGLVKALGEATDAETKLRLEAKIAILDNNEALAKKINAEMEAARKAKELADAFGGAASQLTAQIAKMQAMNDALINKINDKIAAGLYNPTGQTNPNINQLFPTPQGPLGSPGYDIPLGSGNPVYAPGVSGTPMSYADVRLTIDVAQSGDQFAQLIADSVQVAQRSGYSTTSAGSLN